MSDMYPLTRKVQRLRSKGLSYPEIAKRLSITRSQAWRIGNPKQYKESLRKSNANRASAKREHERAVLAECRRCGGELGIGSRYPSGQKGVCRECRIEIESEKAHERYVRIERLWADGLTARQIAVAIGSTAKSVQATIVRMRQAGYTVPFRHHFSHHG